MWGLHSGSSLMYSVTVPSVTMIRLWPGWVCQPVLPPGCQTLFWMYRSDGPLVCCRENQTCSFLSSFGLCGEELETLISPNRPTASKVLLYPSAVVAEALPG